MSLSFWVDQYAKPEGMAGEERSEVTIMTIISSSCKVAYSNLVEC